MNYKKYIAVILASLMLTASACGSSTGSDTQINSSEDTLTAESTNAQSATIYTCEEAFTDRDFETDYEEVTATITLADSNSQVKGSGVKIDGNVITVTEEGTYVFSGSLTNGQIVVNTSDEDAKVQLVLNGVTISGGDAAAISVSSAKKVFLTLAEGSANSLSTTGTEEGAILAKSDLTINGSGSLDVNSSTSGIVSKDDLKITGGVITVSATEHGIRGTDSIRISSSDAIAIKAGTDGLHTGNDEEKDKGYIYIHTASLTIDSTKDALDAAGIVQIDDGMLTISAGDDGIHADTDLYINGGTIQIDKSYEGLEGLTITINAGTINIVSSDDGMNAAGDLTASTSNTSSDSSSSNGFGGFPDNSMMGDDRYVLTINGGTIHVNANGDGLDSNGLIYVNGGELYVDGPSEAFNSAIDMGTTAYANGGTLIAVGSSGMAESFSSDSAQCSMLVTLDTNGSAGDVITLSDSDGNVIITHTVAKSYNCVQISTPDLEVGKTYTLTAGSQTVSIEMTATTYGEGFGGFGGGGFSGGFNGGGPNGNPDGDNNFTPPNGTTPPDDSTMPDGITPPDGFTPPSGTDMPGGTTPPNNTDSSDDSGNDTSDTI